MLRDKTTAAKETNSYMNTMVITKQALCSYTTFANPTLLTADILLTSFPLGL